MRLRSVLVVVAVLAGSGCGDNIHPGGTDGPIVGQGKCGDGAINPGEDCDDGDTMADIVCDADCHFTCGNGVVDDAVGELCDTGIASGGAGACPATCDDGMACTTDVTSGSDCTLACVSSPITQPADGDGCCPPGADSTTDSDCTAACGNGVWEPADGETCDTAITAGAGACPMTCSDGQSCTRDVLSGAGTCQAACSFPQIVNPHDNDGCCPPGADSTTDNDCLPGCGNGVWEPSAGETCDTAITSGPGKCPTTCNDGIPCTRNVLVDAGTCTAACTFPQIVNPHNNDNCCPPGANANNDNDCSPVCGNTVVEMGEQCDDGNTNNTDACHNNCTLNILKTAFKATDLDLRDPHVFVNFLGCRDVTDTALAGFSVNGQLQTSVQTDGDGDGLLDLSPVVVFRPLAQGAATSPVDIHFADCTAPQSSTTCSAGMGQVVSTTAHNMAAGQCLSFLPGTVHPYSPAITPSTGPCFVTDAFTITIDLGGIPITLNDAKIAATYVGNPATSLTNGLLIGFISQTDADNTIIPTSFPLVGGQPLSSLLAGGNGACPGYSDKDVDAGVTGWWFYLNYPAAQVPWTGP